MDPVAIYGGVLATLVAGWNIYNELFRNRARLRIQVDPHIWGEDTLQVVCLGVTVHNLGRRPATITSCRFLADGGRALKMLSGFATKYGRVGAIIDQNLVGDKRLNEGGPPHTFYFPVDGLKQAVLEHPGLRPKWVEIADGTGKRWRRKLSKNILSFFSVDRQS